MTKTTMKTAKQITNAPLSPKNESVLLFWESDGGTKTWRGFLIRTQQQFLRVFESFL
jgi:hypothetical protein